LGHHLVVKTNPLGCEFIGKGRFVFLQEDNILARVVEV
jgi:hypothetical protein